MKLTYRSAEYDIAPSCRDANLDAVNSVVVGQYRGVFTPMQTPTIIMRPRQAIGLQYRGAAYLKLY